MDLRKYISTRKQIETAKQVLNYQPFIISDDIETGVAYSLLYSSDPRVSPPLLFERAAINNPEIWGRVKDSNARLRCMYDAFLLSITSRYAGGSFLDLACNNGYFPVTASRDGMKASKGVDLGGHYRLSIDFLNKTLGTSAEFEQVNYDPRTHTTSLSGTFDVVSAVAIMCHLPDPLNFLAHMGSLANEALFFVGGVLDSDLFLVTHAQPHPNLGRSDLPFPYRFNDKTRLSRGLLYHAFDQMGFKNILELPWLDDWLSPGFSASYDPPLKTNLEREMRQSLKSVAILAMR